MLISLNAFAMIGLIAMCVLMSIAFRLDLVDMAELQLLDWLQSNQINTNVFFSNTDAADQATA